MATLICFSGLPGTGKTTIARALARQTGAVYLRVDSVETALKHSALAPGDLKDAGYQAIAAVARDNLKNGLDVIADTVNPIRLSRDLFAETAIAGDAQVLNVELICSDAVEHRKRIETRRADIKGHQLPDWKAVTERYYEPWVTDCLVLDTSKLQVSNCLTRITSYWKAAV